MTSYSSKYMLPMFTEGRYFASLDKLRFSIIDNQLAFLSDVMGDGCISGWDITDVSSSSTSIISVSEGAGFIGKAVTRTFGSIQKAIDSLDDSTYVYIKAKLDSKNDFSPFSTMDSVLFADATPPSVTTGLSTSSITYAQVSLVWNANTEADFSHYLVERSLDNIAFSPLDSSDVNHYGDSTVEQDTVYYYRLKSVDMSGNTSAASSSIMASVPKDLRVPIDPIRLLTFSRNDFISLLWEASPTQSINGYRVTIQELDEERNPVGAITTEDLSNTEFELATGGLTYGKIYRFTLYTRSINNVLSTGLSYDASLVSNNSANEVETEISISESPSSKNVNGISLTIRWEDIITSNFVKPSSYAITLFEDGQIASDKIIAPYDISSIHSKTIDIFYINQVPAVIKTRKRYVVKIQAIDKSGVYSNGSVGQITTTNFVAPSAPKDLAAEVVDYDLLFTWTNSKNVFSYNIINVTSYNLDIGGTTNIEVETDIGKAKSYKIPSSIIEPNRRYTLEVRCVDEFSLESQVSSIYFDTTSLQKDVRPSNVTAFSGDGNITIMWTHPSNRANIKQYKIWRILQTDDFSDLSLWDLIDTIDASNNYYIDYTVENGNQYRYIISLVDVYGFESKNPSSSNIAGVGFVSSSAIADRVFVKPISLTASFTPGSHDAILEWDSEVSEFDGYEIFRSINTLHNWEKIGSVSRDTNSFIDEDGLLVNGYTYYYMVRKYNNEAVIITSSSHITPLDSIFIGRIDPDSGGFTIDQSGKADVSDMQNSAQNFMSRFLDSHKHSYTTSYDRRIDLHQNVRVSSWTKVSNRVYTTEEVISGADSYSVLIDGEKPAFNYAISSSEGKITFGQDVDSTDIVLICAGLNETQGTLPESRVGEVDASQMEFGKIPEKQIQPIDHFGRKKEEIIPLQLLMKSDNGYEFSIYQNSLIPEQEDVGTGFTFYDILEMPYDIFWNLTITFMTPEQMASFGIDDISYFISHLPDGPYKMISATSQGVLVSLDGTHWVNVLKPDSTPHKVFYSATQQKYFLLCSSSVYASVNGISWGKMNGLDGIDIVRDCTEDSVNLYVSTDKGVYYSSLYYPIWVKSASFSDVISDSYAMWYDSGIFVSTDTKIFASYDYGATWSYEKEMDYQSSFKMVIESGGYYFAVSDKSIWRKDPAAEFVKISDLDCDMARKIMISGSRLLVITNKGLYCSIDGDNIFTSSYLDFKHDVTNVCFYGTKPVIIRSMGTINSKLVFGGDKKAIYGDNIYSVNTVLYSDTNGVIPSVYIDGEENTIGWLYDTNRNVVVFDRKINASSRATIANQYRAYRAKNGGWVGQKWDASIRFSQNGNYQVIPINQTTLSSDIFDITTTFTEEDSNKSRADEYLTEYESQLALFQGGDTAYTTINKLVYLYRKLYSQIIGRLRYATITTMSWKSDGNYVVCGNEYAPYEIYDKIFAEFEIVPEIAESIVTKTAE